MRKSIVITGSTRGIGYHLAEAFLARDCAVTINGRAAEAVSGAVDKLEEKYPQDRIFGRADDVTDFAQVQSLWDESKEHFGRVDIWINNAGTAIPMMKFWQVAPEHYQEVVKANLLGSMYGTRVALSGMIAQGFGALYNMEGFGARGSSMQGMTLYGSTKAAIHFINRSLAQETQGTPVITGAVAPGMVITEMITRQFEGREAELEKSRPILNIIAEKPETVAPVLADKILKNEKNGVTIAFSSPARIMLKFLLAPFHKRDLFS
jgi:NAD(P)-dependent dehydrogenase (short-subunit alcohol dehydrogenase family)